jgi:hypothetical protein
MLVALGTAVCVGAIVGVPGVAVWVGAMVAGLVPVAVGPSTDVSVGMRVPEGVSVLVSDGVAVAVGSAVVAVAACLSEGVGDGTTVDVAEGLAVGIGVIVGVPVAVLVISGTNVGGMNTVDAIVLVGVGVGVEGLKRQRMRMLAKPRQYRQDAVSTASAIRR